MNIIVNTVIAAGHFLFFIRLSHWVLYLQSFSSEQGGYKSTETHCQICLVVKERKKKRKKELIISETHQKYYDLNTNNKKEQSIRFGSGSVHLKESFLKALCGNNFMFFSSLKLLDVSRVRSLPSAYSDLVGRRWCRMWFGDFIFCRSWMSFSSMRRLIGVNLLIIPKFIARFWTLSMFCRVLIGVKLVPQ